MKRQRLLGLAVLATAVLAMPASHMVMGKAHVPAGKKQVCHKGKTLEIAEGSVGDHLSHGDCQVSPAAILFRRDPCTPDDCL